MRGLSSEGRQVQIGTRPRRNRAKEQFWRKVVVGAAAQPVRPFGRFVQSRGLTEPSFYAWRAELARRDQQQRAVHDAAEGHRLLTTNGGSQGPTAIHDSGFFVCRTDGRERSTGSDAGHRD